ncbi:MAG: hypothetical protein HY908_19660 [Myxococcales bacterium]|nr:hypothetical protein [Myxococcales bacterium]
MARNVDERERPSEWLRRVRETRCYAALVEESRELAIAAYRVACAACRTSPRATSVPTLREVHAAALEVVGDDPTPLPPMAALRQQCAAAGLLVIDAS